jgi:nickel transport protein
MTLWLRSFLFGALLLFALVNSGPAWAHKFRLFAAVVGTEVQGQAYFSGGVHPADVTVELRTQSGAILAQGITDQNGSFTIPLPANAPTENLSLQAKVDGHRAEWQLAPLTTEPPSQTPAPQTNLSESQVTAIEVALARQILPLRAQVDQLENTIWLHDILGGLGWLVGLAGLFVWWRSRP